MKRWVLAVLISGAIVAVDAADRTASPATSPLPSQAHASALPVASPAAPASSTPAPAPASSDPQAAAGTPGLILSASEQSDPVFGIHLRAVALERIVEMLQWHPNTDAPGGYDQVWSSGRIGPDGLDAAHENSTPFPFNGQKSWSADATLDGHPLAPEVLAMLDTEESWWTILPDVAQLQPNMAASFQPDGTALSTAQDAQHPQVGDVRVRWRVIRNAKPPAGIALVDGTWKIAPAAVASDAASPRSAKFVFPASATSEPGVWLGVRSYWWIGIAAALLMALLIWRAFRR